MKKENCKCNEKREYVSVLLELHCFEADDVITNSPGENDFPQDDIFD